MFFGGKRPYLVFQIRQTPSGSAAFSAFLSYEAARSSGKTEDQSSEVTARLRVQRSSPK